MSMLRRVVFDRYSLCKPAVCLREQQEYLCGRMFGTAVALKSKLSRLTH